MKVLVPVKRVNECNLKFRAKEEGPILQSADRRFDADLLELVPELTGKL